jgi:hypothetical protein
MIAQSIERVGSQDSFSRLCPAPQNNGLLLYGITDRGTDDAHN